MEIISFDEIWNRIVSNEGQIFKTKTGKEFIYSVINNGIVTNKTNYILSKNDIKKVFNIMPVEGPGRINDLVRGPAYIWAILNDNRIVKK